MRRFCFYHAGCPDGFGAAWAVRAAWGDSARFWPRGHDDPLDVSELAGAEVAFVDIAPQNHHLRSLAETAHVVVLDHHVSSRDRYLNDESLVRQIEEGPHQVVYDLAHSGAILAWKHFHGDARPPHLLSYIEDQDLWNWKLPHSREVNAEIASHPHEFPAWDALSEQPWEELAETGAPIVRAQLAEIDRALSGAHPLWLGSHRVEAVNALAPRSWIGHELATRAEYGVPCGAVYRLAGERVLVSIYSVGDFDVAALAAERGGGGHRNAAGFAVDLETWLREYL